MSDILIRGMEMPTSCGKCNLFDASHAIGLFSPLGWCHVNGKEIFRLSEKADFCPLVPVPPHGRLGDLDRLEQMFADIDNAPYSGFDGTEPFYSAADAAQIIRLAPTIIPADKDINVLGKEKGE